MGILSGLRQDNTVEIKSLDDYERDARIWAIQRKIYKVLLLVAVITIIILI